jgi:DNA-binding response OmpR family regulator
MTQAVTEEQAKKRILVIEDEPDIVRGLRDALTFEGFEVEARGTGAEGLAAQMEWAADCVLLDLMLPDDNGYRVCETLRQRDATVPIIILTAKAQESDKIRGLDAGGKHG